jgi:hypothetical protein
MNISNLLEVINLPIEELNKSNFEKSVRRLLLIECLHNLNILGLLKDKQINNNNLPLDLFQQLETIQIEFFLTQNHLHQTFISKVKDLFIDKDDLTKNILQNIFLKIKILKSIAQIKKIEELKRFNFDLRVKNLKKKLVLLKTELA